ncbi:MAG: nitronate monooxygenase family protein [Synergistales bacterium]|nr:nitronate monooxygenase family protein [Synergistales bacterium]MDY6402318.1 nitronate monooxygenase family protein [Synergistales bacterium]MDY6405123.1 nitronate monooxygenase family protein [Synergistales bacterium]MDY6409865.1 nitronate monooxygenase family protein [Synergistales bacterium]MDY6414425.1 nitronate monooxygenase family protein [Synergistales bacterium]
MNENMPKLKIGKYQPKYPLIQGGMGVDISGPNLAGHVAKCGAIGTIASVGLAHNSPYFAIEKHNYFDANEIVVKEAVAKAKSIAGPDGIVAVNCMVALTDYDRQVRASAEGGANIIISGAGLPLRLPDYTKDFPDVALVPIVSSAKAASLITRHWEKKYNRQPDAFVVEEPATAGGHLGATTIEQVYDPALRLEKAVPDVVHFVAEEMKSDIPVIAAGGIWDRKDLERAFSLGAKGVQMGTRFACTYEGDASDRFKQAYIDAKEEDVVLIHSPAGLPGRAIKNPFVAKYLEGEVESKPCFANCLTHCRYRKTHETFCIAAALVDAQVGNWETGLFFCGSNVVKVNKVEHVSDIISELFE